MVRQHKNFIKEKKVAPEVDSYFHVMQIFQRLDWDPILSLLDYYFLHVVREIYTNMDEKNEHSGWYLRTHVWEHEIRVTRDYLDVLLGCRNDAPMLTQ